MPPGGPGGPRQAIAHYTGRPRREIPSGPSVTVFVGNITERAPDAMVRHLLTTCGPVVSWKRVQGATGKLQAFGFCEYNNPDAGLRAIRLLNEFTIADKALVVKVDAKTRKILEEYVTERIQKSGDEVEIPKEDEIEKYADDDIKYDDEIATERIKQILTDHAKEIDSYIPKEAKELPQAREAVPSATLLERMGTRDEGLDDVEPEKIGVINREIEKFRETMKIREAEKEEEVKKRSDRSPKRERESKPSPRKRSRSREDRDSRGRDNRSKDRERERERDRERERARERDREREREREMERRRKERSKSRSKSRSPVRFDRMRGSRDRDNRSQKEIYKEREMEDEEKERKRAERKATEKEEGYQERLRAWEAREAKRANDYENYATKEKRKQEEQEREARKLKEFLEDYDDERDDAKFYRGRELQRRLADREKEAAKDTEDRKKELDEIEELKSAIYADPKLSDPAEEFQRRLQERERQFLPGARQRTEDRARSRSHATPPVARGPVVSNTADSPICLDMDSPEPEPSPLPEMPDEAPPSDREDSRDSYQTPDPPPPVQPQVTHQPLHRTKVDAPKRKKLPVADIFNQEDDDDSDKPMKKMKPLPPPSTDTKKDNKSADEKRKHIKSLIEKIPTDKNDLFAYSIDWDLVDNQLMEKRIRPWVNKKIAEYIGEPEPSLTDFICSKVLAGNEPKAILEDVQMVLDEEAEVFVVKMWRLLIYEIENKKQKGQVVTK